MTHREPRHTTPQHYRRGDPELLGAALGCAALSIAAVLAAFTAAVILPWLVGRLVDLVRVVWTAPNDGVRWLAVLVLVVLAVVYVGVPVLERRRR